MMEITKIKENKLKKVLQFSVPSIIAMLLQTVITVTDGYFTGNYVGDNALAAINLGLPILYFYLGVGLCIGVGGSVISGRLLGGREKRRSSEVFTQTVLTAIVFCAVISIVIGCFFTPIQGILKADEGLTDYFTEYYQIMLFTYPLMVLGTTLGMFLRADGKPQVGMLISVLGCILNVVMDHIFVAAMGLGVQGSAIGTLLTQLLTVGLFVCCFLKSDSGIRFCRFTFDGNVQKETILNGSSEFIGEMASMISMYIFNYVLMKYVGTQGVAAFTILGFAVYGYNMICIGFGQGIVPLVSVCLGAGEMDTAMDIRKITNRILFVLGILVAGSFFLAGRAYAEMFGCSSIVADMVSMGFRIYSVTFLVMGYDVVNSMYFTSCGDARSSALISSLRGLVLLITFTLILSALFGMNGVWMAAPCSEVLTAVVSLFLIARQKKQIALMTEEDIGSASLLCDKLLRNGE